MTGTVFAWGFAVLWTFLLSGGALFVYLRSQRPQEAKPTRKRHDEGFVTHEELKEALEKHAKALEWEWTEMYEKFDKLHLRLAKRESRAKKQGEQVEQVIEDVPHDDVPDIRAYKRPGSL